VPYAVRLDHVAGFVDQDVVGKAGLFDVAPDRFCFLREDGYDLNAACFVLLSVSCQFNEPAAAVRSPRAAMEDEEHWTALQKTR
jgi:hypothetical protein